MLPPGPQSRLNLQRQGIDWIGPGAILILAWYDKLSVTICRIVNKGHLTNSVLKVFFLPVLQQASKPRHYSHGPDFNFVNSRLLVQQAAGIEHYYGPALILQAPDCWFSKLLDLKIIMAQI